MVLTISNIGAENNHKRSSVLIPGLTAIILLFDQIIIYGLSAVLGRGGGAGALILIFAILTLGKLRHNIFGVLLFIFGACGVALQINAFNPNQLYTASIAILLLYIACSEVKLFIPRTKIFNNALWIILFFNILSRLGFDIFESISQLEANRPTGLYSEPSHLAYYVAIIYYFSVLSNPGSERRSAVPALLLLFTNFTLTALLPIILILKSASNGLRLSQKRLIIIFGIILFILLIASQEDYIGERNIFASADEQSLTVQVLLYYYSALLHFVENNLFFGFGPDGFFDAYTSYANSTLPIGGDLNSTDGSFLLVKLTGELGFVTAGILLFAVCRRLHIRSTAVLLIFLQYTLLRGFGITSAIPVSLLLLSMIGVQNYGYKRKIVS